MFSRFPPFPLRVPHYVRVYLVQPNRVAYAHDWRRAFHKARAEFITVDKAGSLSTRGLDIMVGEPHEAFAMVDTDVGFYMKSVVAAWTGFPKTADPDKMPLIFHHDSRHFAYGAPFNHCRPRIAKG